ncbi:MAG: DUF5667 domain-containing protein [Candidatus Nanosalina sp.]
MNLENLVVVAAVLVFSSTAAAQPVNGTDNGVSPGLTPESPLYFFESFVEFLEVRIASAVGGPDLKAKALANNADERLAEARALADGNNSDQVLNLVNQYERTMNRSFEAASVGNNSLVQQLENVSRRNIQVLEEVKEKVPKQARDAIQGAIDRANRMPPGLSGDTKRPGSPGKPDNSGRPNITGRNSPPQEEVPGFSNSAGGPGLSEGNLSDSRGPRVPERLAGGKGNDSMAENLSSAKLPEENINSGDRGVNVSPGSPVADGEDRGSGLRAPDENLDSGSKDGDSGSQDSSGTDGSDPGVPGL